MFGVGAGAQRTPLRSPLSAQLANRWKARLMFLFFSNRLGCLGSIIVSALITAVILLIVFGL